MQQAPRSLAAAAAGFVVASLVALPPAAYAATTSASSNETVRVSLTASGQETYGDKFAHGLSADGRHVLYSIRGSLWTLDRTSGDRVQQDSGALSGTYTGSARMTPSGRHIAFLTDKRLLSADTYASNDVYVRDRDTDADGVFDEPEAVSLELVSVGPAGQVATAGNGQPRISDDGNVITWKADTTTAWGSGKPRIWGHTRATHTSAPLTNHALYQEHGLSGDGRYVVWNAYPSEEGVGFGFEREGFLRDRTTGTTTTFGTVPGSTRPAYPFAPEISPDARYIAFSAYENDLLVPDSGGDEDLFVIDRDTGGWQAVNIRADGSPGTGRTFRPMFSTDSAYLSFTGTDGTVSGDTNGLEDAFVRSLGTSPVTKRVGLALDGGQPNGYLYGNAVSDAATSVLFGGTASNLVADDTNAVIDVFVRGGVFSATPPPVQRTLSVTVVGNGSVTSSPAGISCPPTCTAQFDDGTTVSLTASPTTPSTFTGYSGDCTGTSCSTSMTANRSVTATFTEPPPPNEPPSAVDDRYDTSFETPLSIDAPGVLANDSDAEGDPLTAGVLTQPSHGSLSLTTSGSFSYTPQAGFTGLDTFTYTASATGGSDTATVTVGVAPPTPSDLLVWSRGADGLWVGSPGGTPIRILTGNAYDPAWSYDRSRIVFAADRGSGRWDLWTVAADGSDLQQLTDDAAKDTEPAWSPDGSRIAFTCNAGTGDELCMVAATGGGRQQLTTNTWQDSGPSWSPDSARLVWSSAQSILVMDADGTDPTSLVSSSDAHLWEPAWSPDGLTIAYQSDPFSGTPRLRLVDADGTDKRAVPVDMSSTSPSWSPDGTYLAFSGLSGSNIEVRIVAPDGTGLRNVSGMAGGDVEPDWGRVYTPPNAPPTATDDRFDTARGQVLVIAAPGVLGNDTDPESDPLTAEIATQPAHGTVALGTDGSVTYTPQSTFSGLDTFTYTASAAGGSDTATVTVGVAAPAPTDLLVWSRGADGLWVGAPGGTPTRILTGDANDPAWSPDRSRVAFVADRGSGQRDLWTVAADGSDPRQLTDDLAEDAEPAWSPNGARIAFRCAGDEICTIGRDGSGRQQLMTNTWEDSSPSWSPDGSKLVWSSSQSIRVMDADGTDSTPLVSSSDAHLWEPAWSPDGSTIAYQSDPFSGTPRLRLVDADGTDDRAVPLNMTATSPTWSPDGTYLAFSGFAALDTEVRIVAPDGTGLRNVSGMTGADVEPDWGRVAPVPPVPTDEVVWTNYGAPGIYVGAPGAAPRQVFGELVYNPVWNPARTEIAFISGRGGAFDVWVVKADGTGLRRVTNSPASNYGVAWSPDGQRIAYDEFDGSDDEIWTIAPDGTSATRLTDDADDDRDPAWSPDGTRLVFASGDDLWTMDRNGSNEMLLHSLAGARLTEPVWSPDGAEIAYTAGAADFDIRVVGATGTGDRLVPTPTWATGPAWSPDGSYLAFAVNNGGESEVYVATLQGLGLRNISAQPGGDLQPDWGANPVRPTMPTSLGVLVSGPSSVVQGDTDTYTFTVHNGTSSPASSVLLRIGAGAPGFTQPMSGTTTSQGSCSTVASCELGTLAPGQSVTVTTNVTAQLGIDFTVRGQVSCSCSDPDSTDNVVTLDVQVTPKLDLTLGWRTSVPSGPGQPIVWTASVNGLGGANGARLSQLIVEFDVPAGITVTGTSPTMNNLPAGNCAVLGSVVRCTWSPASGTPRVSITGMPAAGGSYVMVGRIIDCGGCIDTAPGNNVVPCPPVVVKNTADLSVTKTVLGTPPYMVGDVVSWQVRVANGGPQASPMTRVIDTMPSGFSYVSASPSQGTCTWNKKTTISCALGTVDAGGSATVLVQLKATTARTGVVNTAQVQCDCWEVTGSPSNSVSSAPITVEISIKPVTVTPCGQFSTMGTCQLSIRVPNPNGTTLPPGGTIVIGPLDATNGPRLAPDATFPSGITCVDLGTIIRCTLPGIPAGGLGFTLPLVLTGSGGSWTGSVTWNCSCSSTAGPVTTPVGPLTAVQACVGGQVLFHSNASGDEDVYAVRLDGSGFTNLTDNNVTDEADAVWSPNGQHFVFNRGYAEAQNRRLYIADLDSYGCIERVRKVAGQPNADNYQADWSADGTRLAFISKVNGNHDIYTIGVDGSGLRRITTSSADERAPSWRQDGQRIAYVRNQGTVQRPNWDVFSIAADGTTGRFLGGSAAGYAASGADYSPSFARGAGGNQIIWHSNYGTRDWDLWIMNEDGSGKRKLSGATAVGEKNAEWSDDGVKVVYDAGTGTSGIWIMNANGSGRTKLADTGGIDQAPSVIRSTAPPMRCGELTESGGAGVTERSTDMGRTSGTFWLEYQTYSVKDTVEVLYQGRVIWSTGGPVGEHSRVQIGYSGSSREITIRVSGPNGTAWWYRVECPS